MKTKIYSILALLPLFTLLSACSDVESVVNRWMGEEITLEACMPSGEANTRAGLVEIKDSKDLMAQWQDGDQVQLFACQGQVGIELGKVAVNNISYDRKRATMSIVLPSSIDTGKPYTIYGFCGIEARLKKNSDDTWSPVCTAELTRSSLEDFKAPMMCRLTCKGTNLPAVEFEHFGTYELLHVSNATSRTISFLQLGYSIKSPWYLSSPQVCFPSSGTPSLSGGNSTSSESSDYISIPAKDTKTIISWYMASGKSIKDAQLQAYVNGVYATSQDKKSSDVRIESGHAYHLYVTWDGSSLKFDQSGVEEVRSISVTPSYINFGTVEAGTSETATFTVQNTGNAKVSFMVQPLHNEFDIPESGKAFTLDVGKSKTFTVTFAPLVNNLEFLEQVTITSDASEGTQYISLSGNSIQQTAEEPVINVSPGSIDFGTVEVGQSKTETFTVYNTGKVNLNFVIQSLYNEFDVSESGRSFTLRAGGSKSFSVTFTPSVKDYNYSESITITSDASNGTQYVSLFGKSKGTSGGETSYTSCPDSHHPHMIDLGLPSGTKWACCNVGASKPEDYGGYYAWGETHTKSDYTFETYVYWQDSNGNGNWDWDDEFTYIGSDIAGTQYDAATANWGSLWVMPSYTQVGELEDNCFYIGVVENGIEGTRFTGSNGASIFLPDAGYRWEYGLDDAGSLGSYWSSSLKETDTYSANHFGYGIGGRGTVIDYRYFGRSVRPVRKK